MKILFSPVGNTDFRELEGAPTFRIAKFVKPQKIILYCNSQYFNDIDAFSEMLKDRIDSEVEIIKDEENTSPDDYNYSFKKFDEIISSLLANGDIELSLNAGSGTPAYKSTLMYFAHQKNTVKAYQAPDPRYSEIDVREIANDALVNAIGKQNLRTLINNFDYSGAVSLIESENIDIQEAAKKLIYGAKYALILDHQKALENFKETNFTYDQNNPLPQYLNVLQVKIWRDEFGDFARALSPAISEVLYLMLENAGVDRNDFSKLENTVKKSSKKSRILDVKKAEKDEILKRVFEDVLKKQNRPIPYYYNSHLKTLLDEKSDNDLHKKLADKLIKFEMGIRNLAAHEMIKIDENRIKRDTQISPQELLGDMAQIAKSRLDFYQKINSKLLSLL